MSTRNKSLQAGLAAVRKPGGERAAATPPPATPAAGPRSGRRVKPGESWDERNLRRTFYMDSELWDALSQAAERLGMSKSALTSEAVREYIARHS